MNTDNAPKKHSHGSSRGKIKRLRTLTILFAVLFLAALAALAYFLYLYGFFEQFQTPEQTPSPAPVDVAQTPAPVTNRVYFVAPGDKSFSSDVVEGESLDMPDGPEISGYTFIAWLDAEGEPQTQSSVKPAEDMYFYASYAVAFKDESGDGVHAPYMSLDDNSGFRPNESVTRGEMVETIYKLLDIDGVGSGFFIDVAEDDPVYTAAATLKDLELIDGDRLHPEDEITYGEIFMLLEKLFPAAKEPHSFLNVPEDSEYHAAFCLALERGWLHDIESSPYDFVPRKDFARIINTLIGRRAALHGDVSLTGTIIDVSLDDEYYGDIADAVIEHSSSADGDNEVWTNSTPQPIRRQGYYFIGSEMRYIKADGSAAIDEEIDGFYFGVDGAYSSGDAELDRLVREKLGELVDPSTMSKSDMLKKLYDYVVHDTFYLGGDKYDVGETGWENEKAYQMLSTGKGNCYAYAATLRALSRAIGYDAVCYSGTVGNPPRPHAWVEIEIDGVAYIFDPTLEYEQWYGPGTHTFERFYMRSYASATGWAYTRE